MTVKLLGVDAFKAAAKDGVRPECAVMRAGDGQPVLGEGRTVTFVFSDGSVDRMGDTVNPDGWDLSEFGKNAVALWCHDSYQPPIGRASNLRVAGGKLIGDIEFMPPEINPFADTIYRMVRAGYLNAVSVGFLPVEYTFSSDKERPWGIDFERQKLLEISVCSVPANPNALVEARALGIDIEPVVGWAERVLDGAGRVGVPRDLLEETFRAAKTPRAVRDKYLAKDAADWKVGAARDLPLDQSDGWDGPAAAKRMLDAAGFDGDSPDAGKAKRGFLVYDSGNPTLRGSYKLPFADIVGGELKAVNGGIRAAASRLPQTDAPQSVLDEARSVIDAYEKRFGDGESGKAIGEGDASGAGNLVPLGSCGRDKSQECGMKDPAECAIHAPPVDKTQAPVDRSGRRVSSANEALIRQAMDHHASASACLQKVLDSNATAEDPDGDGDNDLVVVDPEEDPRAKRIREAKALKASLNKT